MHELVARTLYYFQVHLLYGSVVASAAWALTSMHSGSATTKYWIWVATLLNFVLPLGAALDSLLAPRLSWAAPLGLVGDFANGISRGPAGVGVAVMWLLGTVALLARLCLRIRSECGDARPGAVGAVLQPRTGLAAHGVPVRLAESRQAPAVGGLLRTHISLPEGIDELLSEEELEAVLIHELTHARRRDNLIRLVCETACCALWFHPVVWIARSRLALYRELSCDEAVIRSAHGEELVSALAKLASPENPLLLRATASSFLSHRLARLAGRSQPVRRLASVLLAVLFAGVLLAGVLGTIGHTACCFIASA